MSIQSMHHLWVKGALLVLFFVTGTPCLLSHGSSGEEASRLPTDPLKRMHIGRSYIEEASSFLAHMKATALESDDPKKQYEIFTNLVSSHLKKAHAINPDFGYITTVNLMKEQVKSLDFEKNTLETFLKNSPLIMIMAASCITLKLEK